MDNFKTQVLINPPNAGLVEIGNVDGPTTAASTDNALVRWDGTGGRTIQNGVVTEADYTGTLTGATDQATTTAVGIGYGNQPANDGVEIGSDSASDVQTATIIGTTNGTDTVVVETIVLTGVTFVSTVKVDWGVILAVKLSSAAVGTITVREASGNATITTLAAAATSSGVTTVTNTAAYNRVINMVADGATTKQLGFGGTNTAGTQIYDSQALTGTTVAVGNSQFYTLTEIYRGDLEAARTATVTTDGSWVLTGGGGGSFSFDDYGGITLTPSGTGVVSLASPLAFSGTSSITSAAGQPLILATGTSGTALSIASATNAATFTAGVAAPNFTANTTGFTVSTNNVTALSLKSASSTIGMGVNSSDVLGFAFGGVFPAGYQFYTLSNGGLSLSGSTLGAGVANVTYTTASTSTTTGSLINAGGFGNAGAFYNGGIIHLVNNGGQIIGRNAADGADIEILRVDSSNFVHIAAGGNAVKISGAVTMADTTEATAGGAGSLTTAGGIYAAKKIYPAGGLIGTPTNTTQGAGLVGERMSSIITSANAVSLTTATTADVTSITLTPGNWIVWGKVNYTLTGVTGTDYKYGQSTTSATLGSDPTYGELPLATTTLSGTLKQNIPQQSYSVATATTTQVFLVAQATFTVGTGAAFGEIYALRTD